MTPSGYPTDLSPARIAAAVERIDPVFLDTPQFASQRLSAVLGRELVIKNETLTPIGSFKGRGTCLLAEQLDPAKTWVCSTAGNFGQGLAHAARARGATVEAFVSADVPAGKVTSLRDLGARVHTAAQPGQAARDHVAASKDRLLVLDGLRPEMAEGAGTIALELGALGPIDLAIVQVGDGALISGIACWLRHVRPQVRVVGVCASGAPAMARSFAAGRVVSTEGTDTVATAIAISEPIPESLARVIALVDDIVLVDDDELRSAQQLILDTLDVAVEPAGAAGVAALARDGDRLQPGRAAVLLTGPSCPNARRTMRPTSDDQPTSGVLLFGDTEHSPALRHEVPLVILDTLMFCERDGQRFVLAKHLERGRIEGALPDAEILEFSDFGISELSESGLLPVEAEREVAVRVARHLGLREVTIPGDFPVALADRLRAEGIHLRVDDHAVQLRRRSKAGAELDGIRVATRAAEAGITAAVQLLARAEPGRDGRLYLDGAELLTEQVRAAARTACAAAGAPTPPDVMISSVWTGFGNEPGHGPVPAGLPIQVDLWPRHEATGCWSDMTRTFVVGQPNPEHAELIAEQQELVRAALDHAVASVRPGISGRALYDAACDRFEKAGYRTQRTGPGDDPGEGFQFSLGHGVGLEVHEPPVLGLAGTDALVTGDVLAIEPGLWDRRIAGVRFEDLVLVTQDGAELLTRFPYELRPQRPAHK